MIGTRLKLVIFLAILAAIRYKCIHINFETSFPDLLSLFVVLKESTLFCRKIIKAIMDGMEDNMDESIVSRAYSDTF